MHPPTDPARAAQVELILQQVDALPTLSPVAVRLLRIASADDPDLDEVVALIESDPALTARLLALCRRADKGLGDRITTVRRAAVMLGLEAVQAAVLSVQVYELMQRVARRPGDDPAAPHAIPFDRAGFWRYSIGVACAAELIAEATAPARRGRPAPGAPLTHSPEEHFVAGLLHGVGRLVLDLVLPNSTARVLALAERRRCDAAAVERTVIGLDHHTAGKRLAEHWSLPHALQDVIWLHAHPPESLPDLPHKRLIGVVAVARALCRQLHLGWSGDFGPPPPPGVLAECVGIDPAVPERIAPRLHESVADRCRALGLDEITAPELLIESVVAANRRLGRLNGLLGARSRAAARQARALEAVGAFCGGWRPGRSVVDTLGEVVRSAAGLLGAGFYATLFQPRPGEPWQLCRFSADGEPVRTEIVEPPPGSRSLGELLDPAQVSLGALAVLPWLSDHIADACDIRRVQLMPLGKSVEEGAAGPAVVLLHDREPGPDWPDRLCLGALAAAWGAGVAAAAQHEGARRLGERLAASNRQLAEAQLALAEAESLARLGEMAAGAAHEMNNPLTIISGRSQLLAARAANERDRADAAAVSRAAQQLSDLITSLKLIADPPTPAPAPCRVGDAARAAAGMAEERAGTRGRVRVEVPGPSSEARIDRELLELALVELIINALEASAHDPVEVRVQSDDLDDRLSIIVEDRGPGMSPKTLQHAFDPFYSNKPAGRQTGLGLTRARRLVELQGGSVTLESAEGRGVTATITLPRSAAQTEPNQRPRAAEQAA